MHEGLSGHSFPDPRPVHTIEDEPGFGALVISLDFEIHWGVRHGVRVDGPYAANLRGVREAIPGMLDLFAEYGVAATWATVGFLFARDRAELERFSPPAADRPAYADARFDPYVEPVGADETDDPLHYGANLIERIRAVPGQEIGSHTFSHYFCLEPGQTARAFRADLEAALAIAQAHGLRPRSIVFPRNQHNPAYDDVLRDLGVHIYRGNQRGWMHRAVNDAEGSLLMRGMRLLDSVIPVSGSLTAPWSALPRGDGLIDVPATVFLRPWSPRMRSIQPLQRRRVIGGIRDAARRRRIVHVWWHPHNFGTHLAQNLGELRALLDVFAECREREGMRSLSMEGAADVMSHVAV